jgi:hypothetical protein
MSKMRTQVATRIAAIQFWTSRVDELTSAVWRQSSRLELRALRRAVLEKELQDHR